jgi:drug/metabolite transporter (DMT)-like permease
MGRPLGVTVLAIIAIVAGIQSLGTGLALVSFSSTLEKSISGIVSLIGLGFLIIGLSYLLLARGYVKGRERARKKGRMIAVFAILLAIAGVMILPEMFGTESPVWTVFFNVVIILYLGRPRVKSFFASRSIQ